MKKSKISIVMVVITFILFIGTTYDFTHDHEEIHKLIWKNYGINSEITYTFFNFSSGILAYTKPLTSTENCTDSCKLAQEQNEIAGYNITTVINAIYILILLFFGYKTAIHLEDERVIETFKYTNIQTNI